MGVGMVTGIEVYPVPNVNRKEVEKSWPRPISSSKMSFNAALKEKAVSSLSFTFQSSKSSESM